MVVALLCGLSVAPAASGAVSVAPAASGAGPVAAAASDAGPTEPLPALVAAAQDLRALGRPPAAAKFLVAAQNDLADAMVPSLWVDPGHLVAPGYGTSMFADSQAALRNLEHVPASAAPSGSVARIEGLILAADRGIAAGAIFQAVDGSGGLLARAEGMILSGDRWAATSRLDLGAVQYGAAWTDAFEALTDLVVGRAVSVPPGVVGRAADRALRRASSTPAGVHVLAHRRTLTLAGKPEVLFVGAESCQLCGVERWGLVVALSRFGTFLRLALSQSPTTASPLVRSFTFAGARYASPYIAFVPVEVSSIVPAPGGGYEPLTPLTPAQRALLHALDPTSAAPIVDVANRFDDVGATSSPTALAGLSWSALAGSLYRARAPSAQAIAATAEVLTAEICRATGGAPAAVCTSPIVREYAARVARFGRRAAGSPVAAAHTQLRQRVARRRS